MWGAREDPREVFAVFCCLVCQSTLRVMSAFQKKTTTFNGTIPLSPNVPSRFVRAGNKWGIYCRARSQ